MDPLHPAPVPEDFSGVTTPRVWRHRDGRLRHVDDIPVYAPELWLVARRAGRPPPEWEPHDLTPAGVALRDPESGAHVAAAETEPAARVLAAAFPPPDVGDAAAWAQRLQALPATRAAVDEVQAAAADGRRAKVMWQGGGPRASVLAERECSANRRALDGPRGWTGIGGVRKEPRWPKAATLVLDQARDPGREVRGWAVLVDHGGPYGVELWGMGPTPFSAWCDACDGRPDEIDIERPPHGVEFLKVSAAAWAMVQEAKALRGAFTVSPRHPRGQDPLVSALKGPARWGLRWRELIEAEPLDRASMSALRARAGRIVAAHAEVAQDPRTGRWRVTMPQVVEGDGYRLDLGEPWDAVPPTRHSGVLSIVEAVTDALAGIEVAAAGTVARLAEEVAEEVAGRVPDGDGMQASRAGPGHGLPHGTDPDPVRRPPARGMGM